MALFLRLTFTTLCISFVKFTQQSIAGVTYRDNFDFEQRYRNAHECDPLYWHPLHLPSNCAKMYQKMINSRLNSYGPIRFVAPSDSDPYNLRHSAALFAEALGGGFYGGGFDGNGFDGYGYNGDGFNGNGFKDYSFYEDLINYSPKKMYRARPRPPFEIMLDALRQDVLDDPGVPRIEMMPNLGMVAVYQQPISRKSEDIIKQVALDYGKAGAESYVQAGLFSEATTKGSVHTATGMYYGNDKDGPSRTHFKIKMFPGLGDNVEMLSPKLESRNVKVQDTKKSKHKKTKKKTIVDGNSIYYIEYKNKGKL